MTALFHWFPATIHPMVVHFTIALVYLAGFAGIAGVMFRKRQYFTVTFLWMLILSMVATVAAGIAGVISEFYLRSVPHVVAPMLENHKMYGEVTGLLLGFAFLFQVWNWWRKRGDMSVSAISLVLTLIAVVTVSLAGHLGGTMVYDYGLGVH